MDKNVAPTQQLLITRDTIGEIVRKIYVKKSDIVNPTVVDSLRRLCDKVDRDKKEIEARPHAPFKNPERMLAIFLMRKQILENASEIYIEGNEESLFTESSEELDIIVQVLKDHTITK